MKNVFINKMYFFLSSQVDYNSDYDDLEVETLDAEEKYFDEESSQDASGKNISDEEDELDKYLSDLKSEPTPLELANRLLSMNTNNVQDKHENIS